MGELYYICYQCAMALSLLISLFMAVLTWRYRKAPGASSVIALAATTFVWTLGFFLESRGATLEQQLFFNNIGYIGSMSVAVAWFVFALHYINGRRIVTGWKIPPFCIVPFITLVLVWTNSSHHLMWSNEHLVTSGSFLVTAKTYGVFFWVAVAHNYGLIIAGSIILLGRLFIGAPLYRKQAVALTIAVVLPIVWNLIYIFNLVPLPRKDLTPVMFSISGIAIAVGLLRYHLFRAVPFARQFLIEQLSDGIFIFNMSNRLLEANPAALRILTADKNIVGKNLDSSRLPPELARLSSPQPGRTELLITTGGEERFYEMEAFPMNDQQVRQVGWLVILRNVTERRKMQGQLIAQDRLASIGELTSGVAHELNNPLATIMGFSELLLKRDVPADMKADLTIITTEAERAAKIVDNLLTFARKKSEKKLPCDINKVIEKTLELRAYEQARHNIQRITHFATDLPEVMGNDFQLRQVFLNIIINAEFFMVKAHGKGTIDITTEIAGDCIRVSITDDGPGISKEHIKHLFSPFFTTKEVGKGTGLGLSICHGIVTEHGGRIWAESEPCKGATFTVELPAYTRQDMENITD